MKLFKIKISLAVTALLCFAFAAIVYFLPSNTGKVRGEENNLFSFDKASWVTIPDGNYFSYGVTEEDAVRGDVFTYEGLESAPSSGIYKTDIDFEVGRKYIVSYWLKTSGQVSAGMRFSPIIKPDAFTTLTDGAVKDPAGISLKLGQVVVANWTKYNFEFTAEQNYSGYIGFHFYNSWERGDKIYIADVSITSEGELIRNGHLNNGILGWTGISEDDIISGTGAALGNSLRLEKDAGESITVKNDPITESLIPGEKYTLSFRYRNSALFKDDAQGKVYFETAAGEKIEETSVRLAATNEVYYTGRADFTAGDNCNGMRLVINVYGENETSYTFSDFVLEEYSELIANGDFSSGLDGWSVKGTDAGSTITVEKDDVFGNALVIKKDAGVYTAASITYSAAKPTDKLETGRKYTFSFYYKLTGNANEVNSQIIMRGSSASIIFNCQEPTAEWQYFSYEFFAEEGFESPSFEPRIVGKTQYSQSVSAYFADIRLTSSDEYSTTGILNSDFANVTGGYPDNCGILGDCGTAENNSVHVSKTALTDIGGLTVLTGVYGGYEYNISFAFRGNAEARESLKVRVTPYADRDRTPLAEAESYYLSVSLADTEDWQNAEASFNMPAGAQYADISIYAESGTDADFYLRTLSCELSSYEALINLGFELGGAGWNSSIGTISRDTEKKSGISGEYSARIDGVSNGNIRSGHINILPNRTYEISYWIKTDFNQQAAVSVNIYQYKQDGTAANILIYNGKEDSPYPYYGESGVFTPAWIYNVTGSTVTRQNPGGWVNPRYFFTSSQDAAYCEININVGGVDSNADYTLYLDEVSVTEYANVPNLDFESANEYSAPIGWFASAAGDRAFDFRVVNDVYHSGGQSLYFKTDTLSASPKIISSALIPVSAEGNKKIYEVSFWVSSANSDFKSLALDLFYYDENGLKICSKSEDIITSNAIGAVKTLNSGNERSE